MARKKSNLDMKARKKTLMWRQVKNQNWIYKGNKKWNLDIMARKNQTWIWRQASLGSREVIFLGRGTLSTWEHDYHDIIYIGRISVVWWLIIMTMLLIGRGTLSTWKHIKLQPCWASICDHDRWSSYWQVGTLLIVHDRDGWYGIGHLCDHRGSWLVVWWSNIMMAMLLMFVTFVASK